MGCMALQKATQRTESEGLALLGAGVLVTADAAATASSLILNTKTSSWEAQGLAKRGKEEEEEGPCEACSKQRRWVSVSLAEHGFGYAEQPNSLPATFPAAALQVLL